MTLSERRLWRNWVSEHRRPNEPPLPGAAAIVANYRLFQVEVGAIISSTHTHGYRGEWGHDYTSFIGCASLAREQTWPRSAWQEALQYMSDEKIVRRAWYRLHKPLENAPRGGPSISIVGAHLVAAIAIERAAPASGTGIPATDRQDTGCPRLGGN